MIPRARWLYVPVVAFTLATPLSTRGQPVPTAFIGGGLTLSSGEAPIGSNGSVPSSHGYNVGVRVSVPVFSHVAVGLAMEYRDVRRDDDATARQLGYNAREFRLGGGFFDGGGRTSMGALAHLALHTQPAGRLTVYVLGGGGFARTGVGNLHRYFIGDNEDYPGTNQFTGAMDFGGGVNVEVGAGIGLYAQATRLTVFAEEGDVTMIPIQIGMSFALTDY